MVLTQTGVQRKRRNLSVVEDSEDSHGSDVDSDLDNQEWIYYELNKSCDDGFWHDTANTIVSEHLSNNQEARLRKFVLTIAKRIFMFGSLINPSFTYNLKKGSHVMQVEDKYHVIVRREQNIVHIFACTAQENDSYIFSWEADVKKCTRKHALGIQNNAARFLSNPDKQVDTDNESLDVEKEFEAQVAEERQAASREIERRAAELRAAASTQRGRPQEESIRRRSKGQDAGNARFESMFVHHVRDAVAHVPEAKVPAHNVPAQAQQVRQEAAPQEKRADLGGAAQGGAGANVSSAPKVPGQQPQVSNLQPQPREGVAAAQGGAAANVSATRNRLLSRQNNGAARPRLPDEDAILPLSMI